MIRHVHVHTCFCIDIRLLHVYMPNCTIRLTPLPLLNLCSSGLFGFAPSFCLTDLLHVHMPFAVYGSGVTSACTSSCVCTMYMYM